MSRPHKAPQYNTACIECMKIHPSSNIAGLQREAEDRIAQNTRNIDHERSFMNLFIHGLDEVGNPIVNHDKPTTSLEDRIYGRIAEVGAKVRRDRHETSVERGHNTKESVCCEGMIMQVSHERSMELLAEDDMLDENGQIRKDCELPAGGRVHSMFMEMYRFACDRFGADNIVGACIHLDEYTPHMHVFVVPITMKERRYAGKTLTDVDGNPVVRGVLDAKNIFSPTTIKQFWPDLADHLKGYGVSKAEGRVPKSAYTEVATMDAVVRQKQSRIDELSELVLQGQEHFQEVEQRLSDASKGLDNLEDLIRAIEGPNIATTVNMDYDIQEAVAMTLFPSLADWECERRVGENSLVMYNSRTMDSICLNFSPRGVYVREHKRTDEVDHNGRYIFRWMPEQRYADYLQSQPRGFQDFGRTGVSEKYLSHLTEFSQKIRCQTSFADVMKAATEISPSLRYYLLLAYCKQKGDNIPLSIKPHIDAVNKEIKDVIRFPKETKGISNGMKK